MALKKAPASQDEDKTEAFKEPTNEEKGTLKTSPDSPATESIALPENLQKDEGGEMSDATATQQIHSSALPLEGRDPDKAWQDYAPMAIRGLYPHMREGVDYAYGRRTVEDDAEMLHWDERFAQPDMGKIEEAARKLVERDPNADANSAPKQSIRTGTPEAEREIVDPDVAQSELNPKRHGNEKLPSQPYIPQTEQEERERQEPNAPNKDANPNAGKSLGE